MCWSNSLPIGCLELLKYVSWECYVILLLQLGAFVMPSSIILCRCMCVCFIKGVVFNLEVYPLSQSPNIFCAGSGIKDHLMWIKLKTSTTISHSNSISNLLDKHARYIMRVMEVRNLT